MKRLCRTVAIFVALTGLATSPAFAAVFMSDDFSGANLDTLIWTAQDPVGGAGFSIVSNELSISIPGGVEHDVWTTGNDSARVMQPTDNVDFEIEAKFSSLPTQAYQMQGIIVEQDGANLIRFDFYSDGVNLRIFTASIAGGVSSNIIDNVIVPIGSALYMRVSRVGNQWTQSYSFNGISWTSAAVINHTLTVSGVGPFVGNAAGGSSPAFTGLVDYFFNTASPIDPEDGGVEPPDTTPPFIYNDSVGAISDTEIAVSWSTDELSESFVEYGLTTAYELGSQTDATLKVDHSFSLTGLQADMTYHVRFSSTDGSGNTSYSQDYPVFTSALPVFDIWYGTNQTFGAIGQAQEWVNILGNVADPDGIDTLTYSLNGQPALPLTVGPDGVRLNAEGDFNIEISFDDLLVGPNSILITATDNLAFESSELVTVNYPGANQLSLDYSVDWSTVANIQDVVQIVDGLWSLEADSARPLVVGYDRLLAVGDVTWQDYEVTVPVTVHGLDPRCSDPLFYCAGGGAFIGVLVRWPGHVPDEFQPYWTWWPMGALGGVKWADGYSWGEMFRGSDGFIVEQDNNMDIPFEVPHIFKVRAETTPTSHHYQVKLWPQGEAEPPGWNFILDEPLSETSNGSVLLIAHHIDASFGDVVITEILDETPPVISNIAKSTQVTSATIFWQTDELSSSAVSAGPTTAYELGTVSDAGPDIFHSISFTGLLPNTTYHYQISSTDDSGNTVVSADMTFTTKAASGYVCGGCHE